ncbi:Fic family protein [Bdellovibrio bacteriovorus]|uniref:Fic family protein n=1 Tax=Bdellovibrio TaxID=958 RepID=UPI0035A8688C
MEKPPFQITPNILNLTSSIQEIVGELKGYSLTKPSVKLRKENKIRTIHHSLAIEGNSLSEEQITAILENKRVLGSKTQILEVKNALVLYDDLGFYSPTNEKDLLKAHKVLMNGLVDKPGKYRSRQVGVFNGAKVAHMAPSAKLVPSLMKNLFDFIKKDKETPWLLKACIFHYELEFIHPFEDGNGRMGRLWQQLLLMKHSPIFEYLSAESLIHKRQKEYYRVLEQCDAKGDSTLFIEFSLENILHSLTDFQKDFRPMKATSDERIQYALRHFGKGAFSRKDYMELHKGLSSATASRDLAQAVSQGFLRKSGDKALAVYTA